MRPCSVRYLTLMACLVATAAPLRGQAPGADPYTVVPNWMESFASPGFTWGSTPGVFVEDLDRIFVIQRGELRIPDPLPEGWETFVGSVGLSALRETPVFHNCIFVVDSEGRVLETWTQWDHLFEGTNGPHKIRISPYDPERRVWVVNERRSQIHVFSNDGSELLMELGEAFVEAEDDAHFALPQDIAFLPDGSFVVADGIGNSRVVKFDAGGNYVTAWGTRGIGNGEFNGVHAVATDSSGRIYVADRNNDRIQVFDANGTHLATWGGVSFPNDILVQADQRAVWVADNQVPRMVKFDLEGNILESWMLDSGPHRFGEVHELAVDSEGSWYGADNVLGRAQKFIPRPGADPARLIGAPVPLSGGGSR